MEKKINYELYEAYKNAGGIDILHTIKSEPAGNPRTGRPKLRWEDGVPADAKNLGVVNWKIAVQDPVVWRGKSETKNHPGLWS